MGLWSYSLAYLLVPNEVAKVEDMLDRKRKRKAKRTPGTPDEERENHVSAAVQALMSDDPEIEGAAPQPANTEQATSEQAETTSIKQDVEDSTDTPVATGKDLTDKIVNHEGPTEEKPDDQEKNAQAGDPAENDKEPDSANNDGKQETQGENHDADNNLK